jgi:pimeloyl-ACP methyl ester carboxylesterase
MRTLTVNGQDARVYDEGSGAPVVVLHGWGGRIESMSPVLRCLAERHRVVAVDLPGFGDSPVPSGSWGTPDYSAYVRDVVTELGIDRAHFVGHSFGAKVSFYSAAVYPDLVDKLVIVGSPGLRTPPSAAARAKRLASRTGRVVGKLGPPGRVLRQAIYKQIASTDYQEAGELRPILVKVVNEDYKDLLPRIQASTLIVWGSEDDAAPLMHGQAMEQLIPDAGLVVFEGAGHFAYLDESARFCKVVRHFFGTAGG